MCLCLGCGGREGSHHPGSLGVSFFFFFFFGGVVRVFKVWGMGVCVLPDKSVSTEKMGERGFVG